MPTDEFNNRLIDATDRLLLSWVENGVEEFSGSFNEAGEPIMVKKPLTAAHLQAVLKRIAQLGISKVPVKGTPTGDLMEAARMKFQGMRIPRPLPPVSEDDDAATA